MRCDDCEFEAKSEAGLAAHRRWKHSDQDETPEPATNAEALERTIRALDLDEDRESARIQALRSMARALDSNPSKAMLWQQYREGLEGVLSDNEDEDDVVRDAREKIRGAAPLGNAP